MGRKAILNTNGLGLTRDAAARPEAGRPGGAHLPRRLAPGTARLAETRPRMEMNELRQEYADLRRRGGRPGLRLQLDGLRGHAAPASRTCFAGQGETSTSSTPWSSSSTGPRGSTGFEYWYAGAKKVDMENIVYVLDDQKRRIDLQAREVAEVIAGVDPSYQPAAYLAGTAKPDELQVAHRDAGRRRRADPRLRRPEVHGGGTGRAPPLDGPLPGLRESVVARRRASGDARARRRSTPGARTRRGVLAAIDTGPPALGAPAAAHAVDPDHPADRHRRGRTRRTCATAVRT